MARVLRSVLVPCPWPGMVDCSGGGGGGGGRVRSAVVGYGHRGDILGGLSGGFVQRRCRDC
jgi:hypothetical protein